VATIKLDGGLNLNDPRAIEDGELAIALNADFRQRGVVRSRAGRTSVYTSQGADLIGSADGDIFTVGSDVYRNGSALSTSITGVSALGVTKLQNVQNEVLLLSAQVNLKIDDDTVQTWGIAAPTVAPVDTAESGSGVADGTYYYKYTYLRKSGTTIIHESNPSPVSAGVTTASPNNQVDVTVTASSDSQVTHVRVYRTLAGGSATGALFYYTGLELALPTVNGNDTTADGSLGALLETDNDPPPATSLAAIAGPGADGVIFIATGNTLYFSKPYRPESFPAAYYVEVGVPYKAIKGVVDWGGLTYIFTTDTIYFLQGTDPATYYPVKTQASRGLAAPQAVVATEKGILYLAYDGVYAFNGQSEVKLSSEKIDSLFRGETVNTISPMSKDNLGNCWMTYFNGKMFLGYPVSTTFPDRVLVYDFETFKFSIYNYGVSLKSAFVDTVNFRLLAGDTSGNIWQLESGESDNGTAFIFKVRSKELSGLSQQAPVLTRVDIENTGGATVYTRWLSKGAVKQTFTLTDSVEQKRRIMKAQHLVNPQLEVESLTSTRVSIGAVEVE